MPVMSTRGSLSVRFANHLVPKPPATVSYRVADTPGDTGTTYSTTSVTTSSGSYRLITQSNLYDIPGTYTWICPTGVTSISVMGVGGGGRGGSSLPSGGGGSGGVVYIPSYPTIPGRGYTVTVGSGGSGSGAGADGAPTSFGNVGFTVFDTGYGLQGQTDSLGTGGSFTYGALGVGVTGSVYDGITGGSGGSPSGAGGGAGTAGYNPSGAPFGGFGGGAGSPAAGYAGSAGLSASGGGGGGGGAYSASGYNAGAGGGGIGIYGAGSAGTGGAGSKVSAPYNLPLGGGGGSGGQAGSSANGTTGGAGGNYGGGGGGGLSGGLGAPGALRIIWGTGREYPSTGTADTFDTVTIPLAPPRTYQLSNQAIFETPGRYTWYVPGGVTSISVMCVGGGGGGASWGGSYAGAQGGGGGGYAYMYNYPVTPGTGYTIQVGAGGETPERYSGQYWDLEDDGTLNDKAGSGASGGIASWFGNATVCRGGGGTTGQAASWNGSVYTTDSFAWGGYWTLGAGLSGSGLAGGFSDQPVNGASGPPEFCGGGAAGTSSTEGGFDTTGSGSYYSGASYSGGSTGGGGGGGGGYSASGGTQTLVARTAGGSWSPFMNSYAVWPNLLSVVESYTLSVNFTASTSGTYNFQISADDSFSLYVDGTLLGTTTNFTVDNPTPIALSLTAGSHTLQFNVANTVNATPAGFALVIKNPSGTLVWDTRTNLLGTTVYPLRRTAAGGGGIGIYGITATGPGSGAVGSVATSLADSTGGGGGSGGSAGYDGENITLQTGTETPSNGGKYGGGGGAGKSYSGRGSRGGHGVVRIIWGGSRAYPSTDTADSYSTVTF